MRFSSMTTDSAQKLAHGIAAGIAALRIAEETRIDRSTLHEWFTRPTFASDLAGRFSTLYEIAESDLELLFDDELHIRDEGRARLRVAFREAIRTRFAADFKRMHDEVVAWARPLGVKILAEIERRERADA